MNYEYLDEYTKVYENHKILIEKFNKLLDQFEHERENFDKLVEYYYSNQFTKDLYDANNSNLPEDVNKCLLTEDTIYDLMGDDYYLSLRLLNLANKMIQQ